MERRGLAGEPVPTIYDIASDEQRPVTQADIDRYVAIAAKYHALRQELLRLSKEHGVAIVQEPARESLQQTLTSATEALRDADREAGGAGAGVAA